MCKKTLKSKLIPRWLPPLLVFLKLNVDGVNATPHALIQLLDVRFGVLKILSLDWSRQYMLIVKTNYKLVVKWISLSVDALPNFFNMVSEMVDMVTKRGFVMRLIPHSYNMEADRLAKTGIRNVGKDQSAYQKEGRSRVKVKDLKPRRIKDYLEYKFSQRSPALLKYILFNDF
ncbi:hypothetical protein GQ457_06G015010 [Hibiscus cannabinus]